MHANCTQIARKPEKLVQDETKRASIRSGAACACERRGAACDGEEGGGGRGGVKRIVEYESMKGTMEVLSDIDIMKQLEEGKKTGTKVRDFEELAEELGI